MICVDIADMPGGNSGDDGVGRHVLVYVAHGADDDVVANRNAAGNGRSGADEDIVTDGRHASAEIVADRHVVQDVGVAANADRVKFYRPPVRYDQASAYRASQFNSGTERMPPVVPV